MDHEGPAVVIARRPCVLLSRQHDEAYHIDTDTCVRCGICVRLGCPAIGVEEGQPQIDPALCTGCSLCAQACPKQAISQP
jgi:indolepyruvate ferredoxin oxidoreductase alpha subunit